MKDTKKKYWKGLEELAKDPEYVKYANKEFAEYLPVNKQNSDLDAGTPGSRRDFLKLMGFGVAAASLAACEAPVRKAIPYLNKPEEIDPGLANYYASTYMNGGDYCSIVVKTREGRPIKINGNKLSPVTSGCVNAQVEASVLSLYDDERLKHPLISNKKATWEAVDKEIKGKLNSISNAGNKIYIISNTILSPATKAVISDFKSKYPTVEHITYDTYSAHGIREANQFAFGKKTIPSYDFSKASVIVGFGADFLGTWISPIEYTKQYSTTRKVGKDKKSMSRHYHFESNFSLTGANADYRVRIKPSQEGLAVAELYNLLAKKAGGRSYNANKPGEVKFLSKAANDLWANKGKSLVVSGSNDPSVQIIVNSINQLLNNYGTTIDIDQPVHYRQGDDRSMNAFIKELNAGGTGAVIFLNANPVYNHPKGDEISKGLDKVKLKVSTSDRLDETAALCGVVAPDHHYLESWNDASPKPGLFSLMQPVIRPLFDTRQAQNSLLTWSGSNVDFYDYLRDFWKSGFYKEDDDSYLGFQAFWDRVLYDGIYENKGTSDQTLVEEVINVDQPMASETPSDDATDLSQAIAKINKTYKADNKGLELTLYQKVGLGDGSQANNPWLHEMPDPITKSCWDNYVTISQSQAKEMGISMTAEGETDLVNLTANGRTVKVPVVIQPGQASDTIGLALGYGRSRSGKVGNEVGVNAYPFISVKDDFPSYTITGEVSIELTGERAKIARTQTNNTLMGRTIVQESTLSEYKKDPSAGRHYPKIATSEGFKKPNQVTLWKGHKSENHHWGLMIDLNSCTGCGSCIVACQAENNIPVVGKEEVLNRREMHWIRIDRYYSSQDVPEGTGAIKSYRIMEEASDNPEVIFQPMMCQHCNNAPCETVCPVAATTHSTEGLNQMAYNRCIGTRYCANNCPYKVRRFNWFKYHDNREFADVNTPMNSNLGKMVLNPDVTVRSRGVMEKCSLCVQRIQEGKLVAKKEKRRPVDGEIDVACSSGCPASCITFGDMNDPKSEIYKMLDIQGKENNDVAVGEPRAYHVLEELNVSPNVFYLTKIRNKDSEESEA